MDFLGRLAWKLCWGVVLLVCEPNSMQHMLLKVEGRAIEMSVIVNYLAACVSLLCPWSFTRYAILWNYLHLSNPYGLLRWTWRLGQTRTPRQPILFTTRCWTSRGHPPEKLILLFAGRQCRNARLPGSLHRVCNDCLLWVSELILNYHLNSTDLTWPLLDSLHLTGIDLDPTVITWIPLFSFISKKMTQLISHMKRD